MQGFKPSLAELEEARTVIRTAVIDTFRRVLRDCIDERANRSHEEAFSLLSQVSESQAWRRIFVGSNLSS